MSVGEQLAAARTAGAGVQVRSGVAVETESGWRLNVGGADLEAWWPEGYFPEDGDPVVAARIGQTWHVVAPQSAAAAEPPAPPPIVGKVKTVPSGASRITVTVGGQDMSLGFLASYAPVVGHDVALLWQAGYDDPLVLGRRGSTPLPTPPKPKPETPKPKPVDPTPPKKMTGTTTFTATDGGPWSATAGGWSSTQGRNVIQGSWYGLSYDGFWYYGTKPRNALKGATVRSAQIYLPNRLRMGNYNAAATAVLRRHTSSASKRGGKPGLAGSSHNVTVKKIGSTTGWVSIPAAIAQAIIDSGGGIAITGSTYLGFPGPGSGAGRNPSSGALRITWEK